MKILIVDDSLEIQELFKKILSSVGYADVYGAASAREAFRILGISTSSEPGEVSSGRSASSGSVSAVDLSSEIDLILLDIVMPGMSGIEACRIIKQADYLRDTPIIMITADSNSSSLQASFDAGAMDYITKPINRVEMVARVRSALNLKWEMDHRKERERELMRLKDELSSHNTRLKRVLQTLDRDLEAAAQIQRSLLPSKGQKLPGMTAAWRFEPCGQVGGDLLSIYRLDATRVGFYILDVSGHGVQAALLSVSLSRMLTNWTTGGNILLSSTGKIRTPSEVVGLLNIRFQIDCDSYQYFTILYGILDTKNRVVHFVRAGHPPIAYCAPDGTVEYWEEGDGPVGWRMDVQFTTFKKKIPPGSRLFMYSDGLTEARAGTGMEEYGSERLVSLVRDNRFEKLDGCVETILQDVYTWCDGPAPHDDVALLAIELGQQVKQHDGD